MKLEDYPHSLIEPNKAAEMEDVPFTSVELGWLRRMRIIRGQRVRDIFCIYKPSLIEFLNILKSTDKLPNKESA